DLGTPGTLPTAGVLYSCVGGLMDAPAWLDTTCNSSSCPSATAWIAGPSTFALSKIGLDTMYFGPSGQTFAPAAAPYFTPQQLQSLTAYGPITLEANVSEINPDVYFEAGNHYPCSSSHSIYLTISRDWTSGIGPSTKAGDSATARLSTENDSFWPDPQYASIHRRYVDANGWETSSATYLGGALLDIATSTPIASGSRTTDDLDAVWVDQKGTLTDAHWLDQTAPTTVSVVGGGSASSPPAGAEVTLASPTPGSLAAFYVATNGAVYEVAYTSTGGWGAPVAVTATSAATPGGGVAAVARTPTTLDVFFVGTNGALEDGSSSNGGVTWTTTAVSPAGVAPAGAHVSAASPTTENLDAFFVGVSGALYQASWSPTVGWSTVPVSATGLAPAGQAVTAVSRVYTNLDVVFIGNGGRLYWARSKDTSSEWAQGGTWTVSALSDETTAGYNPSIVARTSENLDLYFQDVFGQPYTGTWSSNTNTWTISLIPPPPAQNCVPASTCSTEFVPPGYTGEPLQETISVTCTTPPTSVQQLQGVTWVSLPGFVPNASYPAGTTPDVYGIGAQSSLGATTSGAPVGSTQTIRACTASSCDLPTELSIVDCCTPLTCEGRCGALSPGCGGATLECGGCASGLYCTSNVCSKCPISTCPSGEVFDAAACTCAPAPKICICGGTYPACKTCQ
ncbi:MAG: hypothetical protein ABSE49_18620, partial [Polyangiaceae bacterium]